MAASQLAPPEELASPSALPDPMEPAPVVDDPDLDAADREYIDGSLILDGEHIAIPRQVMTPEAGRRGSWLSPVFVVVLTVAFGFTALIAYLISQQPE